MTKRPLSPHLQIYKPQLTSVLSILHRVTSFGFVAGIFLLVMWLHAIAEGPIAYQAFLSFFNNLPAKIFVYALLASIYYHMFNGVRYLIWSAGCGYGLKSAYASGWLVVAIVFVLTLLTVFFL